jgi:hypothetical protein
MPSRVCSELDRSGDTSSGEDGALCADGGDGGDGGVAGTLAEQNFGAHVTHTA